MAQPTKKPQRSLKSLLSMWFLFFAAVPVAFVTGYSIVQFESAIDGELLKRLDGNSREIDVIFQDLTQYLKANSTRHASDMSLVHFLSTGNHEEARSLLKTWFKSYSATRISLFDRQGRLVISIKKDINGNLIDQENLEAGDIFLADKLIERLGSQNQTLITDISSKVGLELISYTRVDGKKGRISGYIEEIIEINQEFLNRLKARLNLEVTILDRSFNPIISTMPAFNGISARYYESNFNKDKMSYFNVVATETDYGFLLKILGDSNLAFIGLAASKENSQNVLAGIKRALITIVGFILLILIVMLFGVSNVILKPLYVLVEAAQKIEGGAVGTKVVHDNETELGLLTDSFNRMSDRIASARAELENKVMELEHANQELEATQEQLVHSAKMVSLGQLVAGVAHELNNPISFIYSNIPHLKEHVKALEKLISASTKNPEDLEKLKKEVDFEYVKKDLPKLIESFEEGSQRVRDIVIDLRNFSRLDQSQIKSVKLEEGIDNTINLLSGELKNRVKIIRKYGDTPKIKCYASQINQVFMNILTNASHAIDDKGEIEIETSFDKESKFIILKIKDSGSGMPKEVVDRIFEPFYTTKGVGKGTGLGLSISYGIIKKHSGEITVESKENKGTCFEIRIPENPEI